MKIIVKDTCSEYGFSVEEELRNGGSLIINS